MAGGDAVSIDCIAAGLRDASVTARRDLETTEGGEFGCCLRSWCGEQGDIAGRHLVHGNVNEQEELVRCDDVSGGSLGRCHE